MYYCTGPGRQDRRHVVIASDVWAVDRASRELGMVRRPPGRLVRLQRLIGCGIREQFGQAPAIDDLKPVLAFSLEWRRSTGTSDGEVVGGIGGSPRRAQPPSASTAPDS